MSPVKPVTPTVVLLDLDGSFLASYRAGRPLVPEVEAAMAAIFAANANGDYGWVRGSGDEGQTHVVAQQVRR